MKAGVEIRGVKNGQGLVALKGFKESDVILRLKGKIISADINAKISKKQRDNSIRFGPETCLSPEGELGDFLNHSCAPNAGLKKVRGILYLYAIASIKEGEEVVIDYSTILGSDDIWTMRCSCGNVRCRKVVKSFDTLPTELQQYYREKGIVPSYIL